MASDLIEIQDLLKAFAILNIIPIVLFALGASYLEQSLQEMVDNGLEIDRESEVERIRFLSLIVVLVQFSIFLGAGEVREAFPIHSQLIFIVSSLFQFLLQSSTEKKILPSKKSSISLMGLLGRVLSSWILSAATYFLGVFLTVQGSAWISSRPGFSSQLSSGLLLFSGSMGIILGLVFSHFLGPIHLKIMFPSSELKNEKLESKLYSYFKKVGLKLPKMRIIDAEQFRFFPIILSGAQMGLGPLHPVLYFTEMLLKELNEREIEALLSIQVSRVLLKQDRKRFIFTFVLIFISCFIAIPVIGVLSSVFKNEILFSSIIPAIAILAFLICFNLAIRQSKKHAFEADVYCLEKLDISPEDLFNAIRKTHPENHPTHLEAELRIQSLKDYLSKTPHPIPIDLKKAS